MITVNNFGDKRYAGRLGNQIFQFAFLFALNKIKGYEIILKKIPDAQFWKCFDIKNVNISNFEINDFDNYYIEKFGAYNHDKNLFEQPDKTLFQGYFQCYTYFDDYKDELIKALKFKNHIVNKGNNQLKKYGNNLVSLHIRRTDYLYNPIWGDLVKSGYYEIALRNILPKQKVLVFSDDMKFAREYFKNKKNFHFVNMDEYVSLYMMTKCDNHIIANSSFSWMGAYLSGKENIICPNPWFPSIFPKPNNIQKDIVKKNWKKINVFK